nr:RNA polymerase sigma-70 factor [Paenibacillus herberti]
MEVPYEGYRPLLFALAYRMLGSVMDAEDVVQDCFLAYSGIGDNGRIANEKAYLCKMATNRCFDLLQSSARQREVYIGPWLPDPLPGDSNIHSDPSESAERAESISTAYLLLLQQLGATERAVFLLREVFAYSYDEIGEIVGKSAANCRQIFHRARKGIHYDPALRPSYAVAEAKLGEFVHHILSGNIPRLLELLTDDAIMYSDGGGKVLAARIPILGPSSILQVLLGLVERYDGQYEASFLPVNGMPGMMFNMNDGLIYVYSFEFEGDRIKTLYAVANPDKLRHLRKE